MSAVIGAALDYASRGLRVFPCASAAKRPLTPNGFKNATTDPGQVHEWWDRWPTANVAIATGDGLAVIDVDPRNGGHETLAAFVAIDHEGEALDTAEVATGGNGRHLYFRAPAGLSGRVLGPGLDLKAAGGYVVAPPSLHATGRQYVWHPARPLDTPLAELPEWALDTTGRLNGTTPAEEWVKLATAGAAPGERNNATARLAGHLLSRGVDAHVTLELLVGWDAARNRPPLGETEVTKTVTSIVRREARKLQGRRP